ncbi:ATP-dependent sacrificial sulfur transferase LarE [Desulforamulus ruminis]|uniref:Asparagine synthase n=1 Tax=Desulforamulus ruminis (strain ATCC 23193 / DSM 2154 / NCIMB 8452 / DL) TaxID=696281 RepID=F6DNI2_DESRL|nr:ATP-dependent sacrificial sulfur transferase LarE [Desulforamulus ruminis]AEG58522.1 asparagine synthase [Desulforamulus ruminis DSM 2154]
MEQLQEKYKQLKGLLKHYQRVLVAYSGGTDSSLLLAVAVKELGDQVLAVTAISPTSTRQEIEDAERLARQLGVRHEIIDSGEMEFKEFVQNTPERCYHCKRCRFSELKEIARGNSIPWILDGSNVDDLKDFRPGMRAAKELGIVSPLMEAGFTKEEIRKLSWQLGLATWDKPSSPCLASRIPYGEEITDEKLRRVEAAEEFLRLEGFSPVRVRHFAKEARLEVAREQFAQLAESAGEIAGKLKDLGFKEVTLNLSGFASGSLNRLIGEDR